MSNSDNIEKIKSIDISEVEDDQEEMIFDIKTPYLEEKWRQIPGPGKLIPSIYFKHYAKYLDIHKSAENFIRSLNGKRVPVANSNMRHLVLSDRDSGVMVLTNKFAIFNYCIPDWKRDESGKKNKHRFRNAVAILQSIWPWNCYHILGVRQLASHDIRNHELAVKYSDEARRLVEFLSMQMTDDEKETSKKLKELLESYEAKKYVRENSN